MFVLKPQYTTQTQILTAETVSSDEVWGQEPKRLLMLFCCRLCKTLQSRKSPCSCLVFPWHCLQERLWMARAALALTPRLSQTQRMGSWLALPHSNHGRPAEYGGRLFWHGWRRGLSEVPLILTRPGCCGQKGAAALSTSPVSAGWDPSLPSTPGRVKHTHPSQPLPLPFPRGHQPVFCSHFSPPTRGRCSETSGTRWRFGGLMNSLRSKSNGVGFLSPRRPTLGLT